MRDRLWHSCCGRVSTALPNHEGELTATIEIEGKEVATLPLGGESIAHIEVAIPRGVATISYGQGKVRVEPLDEATCPNGICWKTGWISRTGQSIVCVPNHMIVTIEGGVNEVDAVVR